MKKLIALLLATILLLATSALAEGLPYIWQLPQYKYVRTKLMTEESYPEVRITPISSYKLFSTYYQIEPLFLCFPGPDGASVEEFDTDYVHYLDVENLIGYTYIEYENNSFEVFLDKASRDDYILLDGSDGTAAYIDPDKGYAYGLITTKEFGKSSKLHIQIRMAGLDRKMPLDTRVNSLSTAILADVARVSSQMRYEKMEPYWSYKQYVGIKFLDYDFQKLCCFDFPNEELTDVDGSKAEAPLIVTKADGDKLDGIYNFGDNRQVEVEYRFDTYSAPYNQKENQDPNLHEVTLKNGSKWLFYFANTNDDGSVYAWYAGKLLEGLKDSFDLQMYLTVYMRGRSVQWSGIEECTAYIEKLDATLRLVSPEDEPYVATEKPAQTDMAVAESWVCSNCGSEGNTGKFCGECGAARPDDSAEWTCPSCGQVNETNFCTNCGTARP